MYLCQSYIFMKVNNIRDLRFKRNYLTTSLVVQWLRICLPMRVCRFPILVRELRFHIPQGNWACVPQLENLHTIALSPRAATTEKPVHYNKDPAQQKLKEKRNYLKIKTPFLIDSKFNKVLSSTGSFCYLRMVLYICATVYAQPHTYTHT